ncbi:methyltransferase [Bdellovibrionota bacterium FG-2]
MTNLPKRFKGWAIPGPEITEFNLEEIQKSFDEPLTLDALSGHLRILQYKNGHRYSTDDVLAAWYGTSFCPRAEKILDLGCGIGSVGMLAAWKLPGAKIIGIEAQERSYRLAQLSVAGNGFSDRYELRNFDLRSPEALKASEFFDLILTSPPYFPLGTGLLGNHPQKVECRFEVRGSVQDYLEVASRHLNSCGIMVSVFPHNQMERAYESINKEGLFLIRQTPVVFREGDEPLLMLFAAMKASDLPEDLVTRQAAKSTPPCLFTEAPLVIRNAKGIPTDFYLALKLSMGMPPTI